MEKPGLCRFVSGAFCIDPLLQNPSGYARVVVAAEAARPESIRLQVFTAQQNVFDGDLECKANGTAEVPALGCVLSYDAVEDVVKLYCAPYLYNFEEAFCAPPDGDDADGADEADDDLEPDGDADTDDAATDGDKEPDEDEPSDGDQTDDDPPPDGDWEPGDLEPEDFCTFDDQCPFRHYCDPVQLICVRGCTNDAGCGIGYHCDAHGFCIPDADGDVDDDGGACTPATEAAVCPPGMYCFVMPNPLENFCFRECATNADCAQGYACNTARGRCDPTGQTCGQDTDCNDPCEYCDESALRCAAGCCSPAECNQAIGEECVHGRCTAQADGDQELRPCSTDEQCGYGWSCCYGNTYCCQDCQTTQECIDRFGAAYYCNERGRCVEEGCATDGDCPAGHFCNEFNICDQVCQTNEDCPDTMGCNAVGKCEFLQSDGDEDADEFAGYFCEMDSNCPAGQYCDVPNNLCTFDCTADADCNGGVDAYCTERGRCEDILPEADGDETEEDQTVVCTQDDQCPLYHFCQFPHNVCVSDCSPTNPCTVPQTRCNERGRCELIPFCGGDIDDDCIEIELPEIDEADNDGQCVGTADCPPGQYCGPSNTCAFDCQTDEDCSLQGHPGYVCTSIGTCQMAYQNCAGHPECPKGQFCDAYSFTCLGMAGCYDGSGCAGGNVCSERRDCVAPDFVPSPTYLTYPSCGVDADCPLYAWCNAGVCQNDCMPPAQGCAGGEECTTRGRCAPPADGDADDEPEPDAESDVDYHGIFTPCETPDGQECPYHMSCRLPEGVCQPQDCMLDSQCYTGEICNGRGGCDDPIPGAPCNPIKPYPTCQTDANCGVGAYCWDSGVADCGGKICRVDCWIDPDPAFNFPCPTGQTCSNKGRCAPAR
ncbi:MAG: hypothetical protein C4523_12525 [Myxococcales bacterium]|nr:MAG: hypothetical protein C4523_12525 [Myxococcales bacterium]